MAEFTGLTGLATHQVLRQDMEGAQATPEDRLGNVADPRHAVIGEQATPYSWESKAGQAGKHGPYGPENQLLGDESWWYSGAGHPDEDPQMDLTPSTRAAPWPKGIASGPVPDAGPDAIADQLRQSAEIHGVKKNAGIRAMTSLEPLQDTWVLLDELNPGNSDLQALPKQAMSSGFMFGTRDRTQSMARQNEYGFDAAHQLRRYATGSIPGNTMYLRPGGRPMAKSIAGPSKPPIGPDSPFHGDDLGQSFGINGAVLQNLPPQYVAPPSPTLAATPASTEYVDAYVEWY